jgi:hypothetical protein
MKQRCRKKEFSKIRFENNRSDFEREEWYI